MLTAILALLLFAVLIFPHELGHFLMARATGVQVNEFAFGMGPAIWQKQRGETLYSIRVFPIGGYCAMEGEDTESDNERSFSNKAAWQKLLVLIAGSAMNVLICVVIVTVIIGISGTATTKITVLDKTQPAWQAGLRPGDKIVAVNSEPISSWTDLSMAIQKNHDDLKISYIRGGNRHTVSVKAVKNDDRYVIGIMPQFMVSHGRLLDGLSETIVVPDMETRKQKMLELGEVYLAMPGGPGTLEEIADAYSQVRLQIHHGRLICYGPDGFWKPLQSLILEMKECGFADQNAADLISFPGTYAELIELLTEIAGGKA